MPVTAGKLDSRALLASMSKGLFWDANVIELDADIHEGYIIPRTMEYGSWDDVKLVWAYYGFERIERHLLDAPNLSRKTLVFFASFFSVPIQSFKALRRLELCRTWKR